MTLTKKCRNCGKEFEKPYTCSRKDWDRRSCCSKKCGDSSKKTPWLEQHQFKHGHTFGIATRFTPRSTAGSKNIKWKGESASYVAKHLWVTYHYGSPCRCDFCGTTEQRMYHWANVSGTHKRTRKDWKRLCVPCHKAYDLGRRAHSQQIDIAVSPQ